MKLQWIKDILGDAYTDELDAKVSAALGERFVSRADFSVKNTRVTELETQVGQLEEQAKTDKAAYEKELPRTQEGIVQFMAENIPTADELMEAITQGALARLDVNKLAEAVTQKVTARLRAPAKAWGRTTPGTRAAVAGTLPLQPTSWTLTSNEYDGPPMSAMPCFKRST